MEEGASDDSDLFWLGQKKSRLKLIEATFG